jgi:hypothetical protein
MSEEKKPYDDPSNWEYDGGPENFTGEIASPYINSVADDLMKRAFPEGKEAYQKQRGAENNGETKNNT